MDKPFSFFSRTLGRHEHQHRQAHDRRAGRLADVERDLIRTRTFEGRARAKARGIKLGPKFKLTPDERKEALARLMAGESSTAIGRSYRVSHTTILRLRP